MCYVLCVCVCICAAHLIYAVCLNPLHSFTLTLLYPYPLINSLTLLTPLNMLSVLTPLSVLSVLSMLSVSSCVCMCVCCCRRCSSLLALFISCVLFVSSILPPYTFRSIRVFRVFGVFELFELFDLFDLFDLFTSPRIATRLNQFL